MSFNSELQSNNIDLQSILDTINALPEAGSGEVDLPNLSNPGSASDLLAGKQLIDANGNIVNGTIEEKTSDDIILNGNVITIPDGYYRECGTSLDTNTLSTPAISVSNSGLITASITQAAGYTSGGTKQKTQQLTTQSGKTVTPTKSQQTAVASDRYTTGAVVVAAIPSEYQDVSSVTATAGDVVAGKVFVDATGTVVTGTHECSGSESGGNLPITIDPAKTYIFVNMGSTRKSPRLGLCVNGTVTIDWGDGTARDTLTGTSITTLKYTNPHTYAEAGDYVITLSVTGTMQFAGTSGRSRILCAETAVSDMDYSYLCGIKKIIMGNCVKGIGTAAFYYCHSISDMVIPDSVTSINSNAFSYCYYLNRVIIPPSIVRIQATTFPWCYAVTYYDFSRHTSVPALQNVSAFNGISSDCEIRVPAALYDEWIATTNWTTYASQIVAV